MNSLIQYNKEGAKMEGIKKIMHEGIETVEPLEFKQSLKEALWRRYSDKVENGSLTISLKEYSKDIDVITRNRILKLIATMQKEHSIEIVVTDMNYEPSRQTLDFEGIDLTAGIREITEQVLGRCRELNILDKNNKYTEPFLNHDSAISIRLEDSHMHDPRIKEIVYQLVTTLVQIGNVIIEMPLPWDPVAKNLYDRRLKRMLKLYTDKLDETKGKLGIMYNRMFNLHQGEPIISTVFPAEKYISSTESLPEFSLPAIVVTSNNFAILQVVVLEAWMKSTEVKHLAYDFGKMELEVTNSEVIKDTIYTEIPMMISMSEISTFLHPKTDYMLPNKIIGECKPLDWRK